MASGVTAYGRAKLLSTYFRDDIEPVIFRCCLSTANPEPTVLVENLSELTEIGLGNGYIVNGILLGRGVEAFDTLTTGSDGTVRLRLKNIGWQASGGIIPKTGAAIRYAILIDSDNKVVAYWDLGRNITLNIGQYLSVEDLEISITTV